MSKNRKFEHSGRLVEYPPAETLNEVPTMGTDLVNCTYLEIWSALKINAEVLKSDWISFGYKVAPEYVNELLLALVKRANELGYDIIKKYEKAVLGRHVHQQIFSDLVRKTLPI